MTMKMWFPYNLEGGKKLFFNFIFEFFFVPALTQTSLSHFITNLKCKHRKRERKRRLMKQTWRDTKTSYLKQNDAGTTAKYDFSLEWHRRLRCRSSHSTIKWQTTSQAANSCWTLTRQEVGAEGSLSRRVLAPSWWPHGWHQAWNDTEHYHQLQQNSSASGQTSFFNLISSSIAHILRGFRLIPD